MLHNKSQILGTVVALKANFLVVEINSKSEQSIQNNNEKVRLLCTKRNRLTFKGSSVFVGDIVIIESIDWNELRAVISKVYPRSSFLDRPPIANLTHVLITISLKEPFFDKFQVSRFLLKAEFTGQNVKVILTKSDLVSDLVLKEYCLVLKSWGYDPIAISIVSGKGLERLGEVIKSIKLGVLCGPSGVGKTSLINYLLPNALLRVGDVSKKLQRGKNTTRHVELFSINNKALIADTPGFNNPEFVTTPEKVCQLFPELNSQLKHTRCKFRNCLHIDEPGCCVSKKWDRYNEYKKYINEMINYHH